MRHWKLAAGTLEPSILAHKELNLADAILEGNLWGVSALPSPFHTVLASLGFLASIGKLDEEEEEEENLCGVLAPRFCHFKCILINGIDPTNDCAHDATSLTIGSHGGAGVVQAEEMIPRGWNQL